MPEKKKIRVRDYRRRDGTRVRDHSRTLDFPKGQGNSVHIKIMVPSTTNHSQPISSEQFNKRIEDTKRFLSRFGGFTKVSGQGGYVANNGQLIQERVASVETYAQRKDYLRDDLTVKRWLEGKKREWGQESIGFVYNGRLFFV